MKIALDLDGVLADFTKGMVPILNRHLEKPVDGRSVPNRWNWSDLGATEKHVRNTWIDICDTEDYFERLDHLEGAVDLYVALQRGDLLGHELMFLTSRPQTKGKDVREQTARWIESKTGLHKPNVVVVANASGKSEVLRLWETDFFLDDYAPMVIMAKHVCTPYMLRQPWNRYDEQAYSIRSVDRVAQFLDIALGRE